MRVLRGEMWDGSDAEVIFEDMGDQGTEAYTSKFTVNGKAVYSRISKTEVKSAGVEARLISDNAVLCTAGVNASTLKCEDGEFCF